MSSILPSFCEIGTLNINLSLSNTLSGGKVVEHKHVQLTETKSQHDHEKGKKGQEVKVVKTSEHEEGGGKKHAHHDAAAHKSSEHHEGGSAAGLKHEDGAKKKKANFKKVTYILNSFFLILIVYKYHKKCLYKSKIFLNFHY